MGRRLGVSKTFSEQITLTGSVQISSSVTLEKRLSLVVTLHVSGHIRPRLLGLPALEFYAKYTVAWTYFIGGGPQKMAVDAAWKLLPSSNLSSDIHEMYMKRT